MAKRAPTKAEPHAATAPPPRTATPLVARRPLSPSFVGSNEGSRVGSDVGTMSPAVSMAIVKRMEGSGVRVWKKNCIQNCIIRIQISRNAKKIV
jgi:hypothetical protein